MRVKGVKGDSGVATELDGLPCSVFLGSSRNLDQKEEESGEVVGWGEGGVVNHLQLQHTRGQSARQCGQSLVEVGAVFMEDLFCLFLSYPQHHSAY